MLKPRYRYAIEIANEMTSAIWSKLSEITSEDAVISIVKPVMVRFSERNADLIRMIFGLEGRNAMTCQLITRWIAESFFGLKMEEHVFRADYAEDRVYGCPYVDVVKRYEGKAVCNESCMGLSDGIVKSVNENIIASRPSRLSDGDECCRFVYQIDNPPDEIKSHSWKVKLMRVLMLLYLKLTVHRLFADFVNGHFPRIGRRLEAVVGPYAGLIPARATQDAGIYQGKAYKEELGLGSSLKDVAKLIREVRAVMRIKTKTPIKGDRLEITCEGCSRGKASTTGESKFIETMCLSYHKGLVSAFENLELDMEASGPEEGCHTGKCTMVIRRVVLFRSGD